MADKYSQQQTSRRRTSTLLQAVLYTIIFVGILAAINFLAQRYNKSFDSTTSKRYTLSDQTIKIVKGLKEPVTITYWDQPDKFRGAQDLLDRYKNLSPKVEVVYQDVEKKRTQAIAAGIKAIPTTFVEIGTKKQEAKTVTEEEITGALIRAMKGGDRLVCFVLGSGEHSIENTERAGFSNLKDLLEKNTYKTQTLKMLEKTEIPKDCAVVVVGGPKRDYIQPEVDAIKAYAEGGGKTLFLLDPPLKFANSEYDDNAALTGVLAGWGVTAENDLVLDTSGVGQAFGLGPEVPLVTNYESHPIVNSMKDTPAPLPIARSLEVKDGGGATVSKLFSTSDNSFATMNLASSEIKESKTDKKGPLVLGAAGTFKNGGRFVVVGSSTWVSNSFLRFNRDLAMNMFNWLTSDEELISIRPKEPEDRRLTMNKNQISMLFYMSVFMIPLLVVLSGVSVWWKRR